MSETIEMNTNPEVILKKRKDARKLRLEKKQQSLERIELKRKSNKSHRNGKFMRAETLIARHRASEREEYRVERVSKFERELMEKADNSKEDDKEESKLMFVVRVEGPYGARIPAKSALVLQLLRLSSIDMGTFIKFNSTVRPLLRLINPYIVLGTPSLATVRDLIQKRATVRIELSEKSEPVDDMEENDDGKISVPLNDNNLIEEKMGEYGVICVEDIIHEIATLGENFKSCVKFMEPFRLNPPVSGWSPLSKLKRIELKEEKGRKVNNSARAPLSEVDIDKYIEQQI
ncbi:hypothetical protein FOA43_003108 [Brettanomyces nanus]|uniref:Large ribosomal subunit protein uL30-like ferredoxin-like fold domain-containing protein n=1 Tax=Eeniella nana TaxID=13502 RepID=A0A875S464_EENNA|nr:uncharacterized protein FOA43_003108 [Brettanomyces nanus]QPG75748.1 hypothetical protein FOA43_003108 [Brettanomyces nanus]